MALVGAGLLSVRLVDTNVIEFHSLRGLARRKHMVRDRIRDKTNRMPFKKGFVVFLSAYPVLLSSSGGAVTKGKLFLVCVILLV